mgnify:CR=1 FL=1
MAYTTIDDPSAYFHTQLYTGNNLTTQTITNNANSGDFQADWLWIKNRDDVEQHHLMDSSRGANKFLHSNASDDEREGSYNGGHNDINAFGSNGFTITSNGSGDELNFGTRTYVAWQWKCNGGTSNASASESGSNVAYNFQVNTTSKFMINIYTGLGSDATLNLGNQFTPQFMLFKNRSQADDWVVYHHKNTSDPDTDHLHLNTTAATADDQEMFEDQNFAADEINLGTNHEVNADGENYVAYAFAEVQGFSKFGSYTGNGDADGPFIYLGFKPAWLMIKPTSLTGYWVMLDNKRNTPNGTGKRLGSNASDAEYGSTNVDLLSNGFKVRAANADSDTNGNGSSYIYMAFAEHPFVSSEGVPVTAK